MRIANVVVALGLVSACGKSENAGAEEAKKQAELELKAKVDNGEAATKLRPPVPGQAHVPCTQLIDVAKYQEALGETEPMTVDENKTEPEAAASCSLRRGGTRMSEAEQKAKLKKEGRLGILPGDEVCNVSAFCWTIEDADTFKAKCGTQKAMNRSDDDSMGSFACKQTVAVGADDVFVYRFFDADTKCILQVKGGASQVDNEAIRKCAITARDTIGPAQIAVDGSAPPAAKAEPAGSGT